MCSWPRGESGYTAVTGDVTCAFFHAEEDEDVYVDPPNEWKEENGYGLAWKLKRQPTKGVLPQGSLETKLHG